MHLLNKMRDITKLVGTPGIADPSDFIITYICNTFI